MVAIEVRTALDGRVLAEVRGLLAAVEAAAGTPPLGEHKDTQLRLGVPDWTGVLARDATGTLVGYAHLRWNDPGEVPRATVELAVAPGADLAGRLLQEVRGVLAGAGGGVLYLWLHQVEDPQDTLATRAGFRVQRRLAVMTRPLDGPVPPASPADGIAVRPFRPGLDDETFLAVNNRAFAGHPEQGGWTVADLAERTRLAWFDPDGLLLAWRGDQALGFHWTKVDPARPGGVGEVYVLGIDPAAQGLGLGRALLRAGLAHLAERGCRAVALYVDAANPGAVRLYTGEGFTTRSLEVCYEDEVRAAAPPGSSL